MSQVTTHAYAHSHSATYVSDKMRQLLRDLLANSGLSPDQLMDDWVEWVERAARTWLDTEDLLAIIIEFYEPGQSKALGRWDFPIDYGTADVEEMWTDRRFLEQTFAKAPRPPAGCQYRIVLNTRPGRPDVAGVGPTKLREISGLTAREVGTVIATPHMTASARFYK